MPRERPKLYVIDGSGSPLEPKQKRVLDAIKARHRDVHWQFFHYTLHYTFVFVHTSTGHYLIAEDGSYDYVSNDRTIRLSMPGPTEGGFQI